MRKTLLSIAAAALALPAASMVVPTTTAAANPPHWAPAHGARMKQANYDRQGRYREPRKVKKGDRVWRGRDGRYYCERGNGTTGLIIGAAGGALLGREIDGGRDRTLGTVLGGAAGALLGREIDRGQARCR